jgi:predicted signal transduction protein with EAL and GGDEF domain
MACDIVWRRLVSETGFHDPGVGPTDREHAANLAPETGRALLGQSNSTTKSATSIGVLVDGDRLERAIERGKIYPVFQPIVRLASGSISGFEVLARWNDDELGMIPPTCFIPG